MHIRRTLFSLALGLTLAACSSGQVPQTSAAGGSPVPPPTGSAAPSPTGGPAQASAPGEAETGVREAFRAYKEAALSQDGDAAVAVTASPIFDFYDRTRELALTAAEDDLSRRPTIERLTAYVLRAEIDPVELRAQSPEQLVATAVERGLTGEQGISNLELGEVRADGAEATAQLVARGQTTPLEARFLQEDGTWKLDLSSLLAISEDALESVAARQGVTVDQLIGRTLEQSYGAERAARLRTPPGA